MAGKRAYRQRSTRRARAVSSAGGAPLQERGRLTYLSFSKIYMTLNFRAREASVESLIIRPTDETRDIALASWTEPQHASPYYGLPRSPTYRVPSVDRRIYIKLPSDLRRSRPLPTPISPSPFISVLFTHPESVEWHHYMTPPIGGGLRETPKAQTSFDKRALCGTKSLV
jgi:hypothetical protein